MFNQNTYVIQFPDVIRNTLYSYTVVDLHTLLRQNKVVYDNIDRRRNGGE